MLKPSSVKNHPALVATTTLTITGQPRFLPTNAPTNYMPSPCAILHLEKHFNLRVSIFCYKPALVIEI